MPVTAGRAGHGVDARARPPTPQRRWSEDLRGQPTGPLRPPSPPRATRLARGMAGSQACPGWALDPREPEVGEC